MNHAVFIRGGVDGFPVSSGMIFHFDASSTNYLYTDAGTTNVTSNGQSIYRWKSKFSNNYFDQATLSSRPTYTTGGLNGKSYALFDGINDRMEMPWSSEFATNARSFFAVMTPGISNAGTTYPYFFSLGQATKGTQLYMYNNNPKYWEFSQGSWGVNYVDSSTSNYGDNVSKVLVGRSQSPTNPTGLRLWVSGTETTAASISGSVDYGTPPRAILGGEPDGTTSVRNISQMRMYEWGIFNRYISDSERDLIANYLRSKYSIT